MMRSFRLFIIIFLSLSIFGILSQKYIGSPGGRVMGSFSPLSWSEISDNLWKYLLGYFFASIFFLFIAQRIQKFEKKQNKENNNKSSTLANNEDAKEKQD